MTDQHGGGTRSGLGVEDHVSGLAGCCFRPDSRRLVYLNGGNGHVVIAQPVELLLYACGNLGRFLLKSVIDHNCGVFQIAANRHVTSSKGECERVNAA